MSVIFQTRRSSYRTWMPPLQRIPSRALGDATGSNVIPTGTDVPGTNYVISYLPDANPTPPAPGGSATDVYGTSTVQPIVSQQPPTINLTLPSGSIPNYNAQQASAAVAAPSGVSLASILPSGLSTWLTAASPISSIPNYAFYGGASVLGLIALRAIGSGGKRRRRRR